MVIFGASGDLAHRKLLPALYSLTRDRLLPSRFAIVGVRATRDQRRGVPRGDARRLQRARAPPPDRSRAVVGVRARTSSTSRATTKTPPRSPRSSSGSTTSSARSACPATASSISRRRRRRSRRSSAASARPSWRPSRRRWGAKPVGAPPPFARVIIEKPFGTDLETARALNRDIHETLDERSDLPDRSLPRQRDGPEPAGVPLRERHLRAALEQPLRRPRADHRRREHRRRGPRRLLRAGGQPARHGAEPPAPGPQPVRDGAARRLRRRTRCATKS